METEKMTINAVNISTNTRYCMKINQTKKEMGMQTIVSFNLANRYYY